MPTEPNQPQWAGNPVQRFFRGAYDKIAPGNQRGPDGTLQNEWQGALGIGARGVAGFLGGPVAGQLAGRVAGSIIDGNGLKGALPNFLGGGNQPQQPYTPWTQADAPTRQQFPMDTSFFGPNQQQNQIPGYQFTPSMPLWASYQNVLNPTYSDGSAPVDYGDFTPNTGGYGDSAGGGSSGGTTDSGWGGTGGQFGTQGRTRLADQQWNRLMGR